MHSWRERMPEGMRLKSDGFASNLYDPGMSRTLARYSAERGLPYQDIGYPVPLETFADYGLDFQKRLVPDLEKTDITLLKQAPAGFLLRTADGHEVAARRVIVAVGITHFGYVPPPLAGLPADYITHSSAHRSMSTFRGRRVAVVGAGASAVDLAALMHAAGVDVQLIARRETLDFHPPPVEPRAWSQRILKPRSGLGLGWRSRLCSDAPLLFHALPTRLRLRAVRRHLGPAPGWFMKDQVVGQVPMHLGTELIRAVVSGDRVTLSCARRNGGPLSVTVDHIVAGTGYRVSLRRLKFLDEPLRQRVRSVEDAPILNRNFETSVPGLFMVGVASANCFGPIARFAYGAGFTARRLSAVMRTV